MLTTRITSSADTPGAGGPTQVGGNCDVGGGMTTTEVRLSDRFSARLSTLVAVTFKFLRL